MHESLKSTRIAVLLNGYDSPYKPSIRESFQRAITTACLTTTPPTIDFFDPIYEQIYPEPANYDLIVLSGGTEDPMGSAPWVQRMQDFLRTTVDNHPKQKIVGICWGHQTIHVTFGGSVGDMEDAEVGVIEVMLTQEGKQFLPMIPHGSLHIHEFHKRDIKIPAQKFIKLGEQNQSFVNNANTILTFQGHPELNTELAAKMLDGMPSYMGVDTSRREALKENIASAHDGVDIWRRILLWIKE